MAASKKSSVFVTGKKLDFESVEDDHWIRGSEKVSKKVLQTPPPVWHEAFETKHPDGVCDCKSNPTREEFHKLGWYAKIQILWPWIYRLPLAPHHIELWEHSVRQVPGLPSVPFAAVWSRGQGKSTSAECITALLGLEGLQTFVLYTSGTQSASDKHVESIAELLEADSVAYYYPEHAEKAVGKFGQTKGWRRSKLVTSAGFTVEAVGLDSKVRGIKQGNIRPTGVVLDDVDETGDSKHITNKRWATLTNAVLPAGATDGSTYVMAVQNMVSPEGVMARIVNHKDGVLRNAVVSGPIPALWDAEFDKSGRPVRGRPSWPEGQPLEICQAQVDLWGPKAFRSEAQHDFTEREGSLWRSDWLVHDGQYTVEDCIRVVVGYDPGISDDNNGDEHGIVVAGLLPGNRAVILDDLSGHYTTKQGADRVRFAEETYGADILYETNQGKDHVKNTLRSAGCIRLRGKPSKGSKLFRALPVAQIFEQSYDTRAAAMERSDEPPEPTVVMARKFTELEHQMMSWVPEEDKGSPDRVDALVFAISDLIVGNAGLQSISSRVRRKAREAVENAILGPTASTDPRILARTRRMNEVKQRRERTKQRIGR